MSVKKSKWVSMLSKQAFPTMRLFCFPYSGGSAQIFKDWPALLPSSVQLIGIQYPGRGSRFTEAPFTSMESLLPELHREIKPFLDLPFAFFGHSLGAAICYELARLLQQEGFKPKHIFVSGRNAPHRPRQTELLHNLPEDQFRERLQTLGGTSEEVLEHPELMDLVAPLIRADFTISETYSFTPGVELSCPLSALGGDSDPLVPEEGFTEWERHTNGPFAAHILEGGHFFLDKDPAAVMAKITPHLS